MGFFPEFFLYTIFQKRPLKYKKVQKNAIQIQNKKCLYTRDLDILQGTKSDVKWNDSIDRSQSEERLEFFLRTILQKLSLKGKNCNPNI